MNVHLSKTHIVFAAAERAETCSILRQGLKTSRAVTLVTDIKHKHEPFQIPADRFFYSTWL